MTLTPSLFRPLLDHPAFGEMERRVRAGEGGLAVSGLVPSAGALVLTLLRQSTGARFLLVVPDDAALDAHERDHAAMTAMLGRDSGRILTFPALDADPYDAIPPHREVLRERVVALARLAREEVDVLLVPARALLSWLPSAAELGSRIRVVRRGDEVAPDRLVLEAMSSGYSRVDTVSAPGEVSRRGGIVDIYPPTSEEPVRIEFFGDTVDSLRSFDTDRQRSTGKVEQAVLGPAVENPPTEEALRKLARYLEDRGEEARREGRPIRRFLQTVEQLREQGYLPGLEALSALTAARPSTLLDHARGMLLVVDEPERCEEELERAVHDARVTWERSEDRVLPPPSRLLADPLKLRDRLRSAHLMMCELAGDLPEGARAEVRITARRARAYEARVQELAADLREATAHRVRTLCFMRTAGSARRIADLLDRYGLHPALDTGAGLPEPFPTGGLFVVMGRLREGMEFPGQALSLLTEREVFGEEEEKKAAERRGPGKAAAFLSDFRDLKVGDLVVHVDHGVARYTGLGRPKGGSLNRDFMVLEFAGRDRLFVPVDRLDLVQRYSGVAGRRPRLDRLGGSGWERVKRRVGKSVREMAKELLELYARRAAATGHAFSRETPWMRELEGSFPYETTPDQERAIREVMEDMESPRPMDRLVVGDVGYGKTEVAVRAAFKAVMDGFQAAVLAPTTVLAAQHFDTFRQRFAPFPVRVQMISRFRSPAEIRRILEEVATGQVDVLIGTHRLLSRDVRFHRLGLLVVDEEQRFGVAHKERLKKLSLGLDVLAMTATPIPRTLQMSLAGVRDLSVIETPPPGRMAIQTYLTPFRKNVIAQALRQELRRGGQAFVVHNRIETLPALTRAVTEIVPEARVVMAHGRMRERQLESVMLRFVRHDADVLVTTTIIENGLDIPRANTIVVNRADRFGLAQLYQLRGRVGRSAHHAYAYFVIPGRRQLAGEALHRLKALQEFSELGAGFRLAAADLEIRGAGEFLGTRQHGHIAALGFDLYCQMLERAVQELRGEPVEERAPASLRLGVDIKIPHSYMPEEGDRLAIYKRLALARDEEQVDRIHAGTEDRFGRLPAAARNLFALVRLRLLAEAAGVESVSVAEGRFQIRFREKAPVEPGRIVEMVARAQGSLTPSGMMVLPAPSGATERVRAAREIVERILGKERVA